MVTMGFLSNVLGSVLRAVFPRQFREELAEEVIKIPTIFLRKIAKTGRSNKGNRNLFAFTFERNETDRSIELIRAIEREFELSLDSSDVGYDDSSRVERPPFEYPQIEVGKE